MKIWARQFGIFWSYILNLAVNFRASSYLRSEKCSLLVNLLCVKSHEAELSILGAADIDLIIESFCMS